MSLVAYGNSDSESDASDFDDAPQTKVTVVPAEVPATAAAPKQAAPGHISDEDDEDLAIAMPTSSTLAFALPKPKTAICDEEDDDEFLRKKPIAVERPPPPPKTNAKPSGTVKIVLPALSSFAEHKQKDRPIGVEMPKALSLGGLLSMLPKPKSMQFGQKTSTGSGKASTVLVPDSISRPKPKPVVPVKRAPTKSGPSKSGAAVPKSDSEDSDSEDFFSLNTEHKLPEVSEAEIAAMVAKKASEMSRNGRPATPEAVQPIVGPSPAGPSTAGNSAEQLAIEAMLGQRQAKRSRHMPAPDDIIDISCDQVMPDRDEWMRTQLTGSTEYQPRGLVDSAGPGQGTKRKHQITYLAHQAKVNEQELQAMWAANRNTRRQTQSKYGF